VEEGAVLDQNSASPEKRKTICYKKWMDLELHCREWEDGTFYLFIEIENDFSVIL
jgi:aspartate/methionine/tyrosine aminotransferase